MPIITLLTDFGLKDPTVGSLKGKILTVNNSATIVDISHQITPFNFMEAGYASQSAYASFPKGTIHIIGVNAEREGAINHLVMEWENQFFICADNGVLNTLVALKKPSQLYKINIHNRLNENATDLDLFVTVANHIASDGKLNFVGEPISDLLPQMELSLQVNEEKTKIKGHVVYIDHFGNAVTNISKKVFTETTRGRKFEIQFNKRAIRKIHSNYSDFPVTDKMPLKNFEGNPLALFNEQGFLEIAIFKGTTDSFGSANSLLGLRFRDTVMIQFTNNETF